MLLTAEHRELYEAALRSERPTGRLSDVVRQLLKDSWRSREDGLAELEELRTYLQDQGRDADEDVVLEVMDFLTGWSAPHMSIPAPKPHQHGRAVDH